MHVLTERFVHVFKNLSFGFSRAQTRKCCDFSSSFWSLLLQKEVDNMSNCLGICGSGWHGLNEKTCSDLFSRVRSASGEQLFQEHFMVLASCQESAERIWKAADGELAEELYTLRVTSDLSERLTMLPDILCKCPVMRSEISWVVFVAFSRSVQSCAGSVFMYT